MDGHEYIAKKQLTENFLRMILDNYPLDQLANFVTWTHQSDDEVHYFANWLDLGDAVENLIEDFEIDIDELFDDVMTEKRRAADEAAEEEYQRFLDAHR